MIYTDAVAGAATNARGWSAYINSLCDNCIANFTQANLMMLPSYEIFSPQIDFVSVVILVVITVISSFGVKCSARFNNFFAMCNVMILLFFSVIAFTYAEPLNWKGQFLAFGWKGVVQACGACFWAFSGFEIIALSVAEANKPTRDVPLSTLFALCTVAVLYISTSASLTLVTDYRMINKEAPLPSALDARHIEWARYAVTLGPLCGLTTILLNCQFNFIRTAYAMAQDGLLFVSCGQVSHCSRVPVLPAVVCGCIAAALAIFIDIREIISFGINITLFKYMLVSVAVIIIRFKPSSTINCFSKKVAHFSEIKDERAREDAKTSLLADVVDDLKVKIVKDAVEDVAQANGRYLKQTDSDIIMNNDCKDLRNFCDVETNSIASDNDDNDEYLLKPASHRKDESIAVLVFRIKRVYHGTFVTLATLTLVAVCIAFAFVLVHYFHHLMDGDIPTTIAASFLSCLLALLIFLFSLQLEQNSDRIRPFQVMH